MITVLDAIICDTEYMALSPARILSRQDQRYGTRVHKRIGSSDNAQLELCTVLNGEAWASSMKDRGYKSLVLTAVKV